MEGILKVPHSINEEDITSDSQTKIILKCKKFMAHVHGMDLILNALRNEEKEKVFKD